MKQPAKVDAGIDVDARALVIALQRDGTFEPLVKTDRVDALGLLEFLRRMEFVPWTPPADAVLALQQVSRRLVQLREELTREQARLHAIGYTPDRDGLIAADLRVNIRHLQKR